MPETEIPTVSTHLELPAGYYIAIDADCPGCGWGERRARFDEHGPLFSCRKCAYVSRERER